MKALITGASSGIGYHIAKYLSKLGYDLIVVARRRDCLENLKLECKTNVRMITLDLSKEENVYELYHKVRKENIDILVNNAGCGMFGYFEHVSLEKELEMLQINVIALHILTKLFLKDMQKRQKGYILNVGSLAGFTVGPLMSSYYASKSYVVRLTQAIYYELKKSKSRVKISVLCPGPVDTQFNENLGITFTTRPLSSEYVAKYGVDSCLKGKQVIIPGKIAKMTYFFSKILPDSFVARMNYYIQYHKKRKNIC